MNSTNSTFNPNNSIGKRNAKFIIKNNSNIKPSIAGSNVPHTLTTNKQSNLERNIGNMFNKPARPPSQGLQEKVTRVRPKEEYFTKANTMSNDIGHKDEINLNNYVLKSKYEELERSFNDLQKKYELSLKSNTELKNKSRQIEYDYQKQTKKLSEAVKENKKLEATIKELKEKQEYNNIRRDTNTNDGENDFEEAKIDYDEMRSMRLAMRYETQNILLNQLSQIAALQMLYERPRHAEVDFDNPDTDNMTYEQLLQLEERMGKVSKGLSKEEIKKIQKYTYTKHDHKGEEICSICFSEFETGLKVRKLPCNHEYHSKCIKQWLTNEKTCPICKHEVMNT